MSYGWRMVKPQLEFIRDRRRFGHRGSAPSRHTRMEISPLVFPRETLIEPLLMCEKERARWEDFGRVSVADLKLVKASKLVGLSYRQSKALDGV